HDRAGGVCLAGKDIFQPVRHSPDHHRRQLERTKVLWPSGRRGQEGWQATEWGCGVNGRPKTIRCAIYTRKSTEHNLDLEFNSLHAQREACEAYIKSQAHEGWRLVHHRFDDGAFSGASLERPALQELLTEVRAGKVDVNRLTRSL